MKTPNGLSSSPFQGPFRSPGAGTPPESAGQAYYTSTLQCQTHPRPHQTAVPPKERPPYCNDVWKPVVGRSERSLPQEHVNDGQAHGQAAFSFFKVAVAHMMFAKASAGSAEQI